MDQSLNFIEKNNSADETTRFNEYDISKIKARDAKELSKIFSNINPKLIKFVASQSIFAEAAEEIIHDSWAVFFSGVDQFEGRSSLQTYLFGIALNKVREYRRKLAKMDFEENTEKMFENSFTLDGWWSLSPSDPEKIVNNSTLGAKISHCLEGLSAPQKAAFLLIESEDETPEAACNILDVTVTHLRVLIFRAKAKLRACLEGQLSG